MLTSSRSLSADLFPFQRVLDNFLGESLILRPTIFADRFFGPETEVYSKNGTLVYRVAFPGVDPKDVDLSVTDHTLTLKVERKTPADVKEGDWHAKGFSYGKYQRSWRLPKEADTEKLNASYNNGVLEITVPVAQAALPKKIEVKALAE
jgi:HSP20 family protein